MFVFVKPFTAKPIISIMRRLLLMGLLLSPFLGIAQGFQVNLHGEKQIGMGHTGTGLLQDGASVLFNPGAVAMLPENYLQGGVNPLFFNSSFLLAGSNQQENVKNNIATPFNIYGVWGPKNAKWKVGMGIYTPFGGLTEWGNTWSGKYSLISLNLKAIYFQPTLSYKINDVISIGAGFVIDYGSVNLKRAIPTTPDGQAELDGSGSGTGFNVGVFIKASPKFTIGLDYRSKVQTTINDGKATFNVPASLAANFPSPNTFSASIPLPATASIGLGYKPCDKWLVAFDFEWVNWDVYKSLDFNYGKTTATLKNTSSPRNYEDAYDFRAGAQYQADKDVFIRIGGGYATTPVKDGYVTPEAPDANRVYGTAGLGIKAAKHLDIDIAFEYEHLMSRTQTNIESNLSGTFQTNVFIPGISIAYHW
jgi:long-chain fatty acid transport protein